MNITKHSTAAQILPQIPEGKQLVKSPLEAKMKMTMGNLESFVALNQSKLSAYTAIAESQKEEAE